MKHFRYYIYIMASATGVIYIGVTNSLIHRVYEHKHGLAEGFTKKYKCAKLVYYEETNDIGAAIDREKELKKWRRSKKTRLITDLNPKWLDLSEEIE